MTASRDLTAEPPWLGRVVDHYGATIGSAVVIDDTYVVTCAHLRDVVPGAAVTLVFPYLQSAQTVADVVEDGWFPVLPDGSGDLAVLRMRQTPEGMVPAPLSRVTLPAGRPIRACGFPDHSGLVRWVDGKLAQPPRREWVQIDPVADAFRTIKGGFSGGPVWDTKLQAVVGLVVAKDGGGTGQMLPVSYLCEFWPPLVERTGWRLAHDQATRGHWWPRASGLTSASEEHFRFRGRGAALERIVAWLADPPTPRALVVTGSPGAGKSAVLSRIVTTSDPDGRGRLPADDTAVRAMERSVHCAVHAKGRTALEVAQDIVKSAGGPLPRNVDELPAAVSSALAGHAFNVIIDAVDEAASPVEVREILTSVVQRLTADVPGTRVVCGTRQRGAAGNLLRLLSEPFVVDLDTPEYFALEDLVEYATVVLRTSTTNTPVRPYASEQAARPLAKRIAELSERNFLIAGLTARFHGSYDDAARDPADFSLNPDLREVLCQYLARLPPLTDEVSAADALTALAFAQPPGFTSHLWASAITGLMDAGVNPLILDRFARSAAANFLIETTDDASEPAVQIFHQALVDALLRDRADLVRDRRRDERALTQGFAQVGRALGWSAAPSYLLRSLPAHAARARMVGALLDDTDFLVHVDPASLLSTLDDVEATDKALIASIYRTSCGSEFTAAERRALLAYDAARFGMRELATRLASSSYGDGLAWRVRWATGRGVDTRLRSTLTGHSAWVGAVACTTLDGRPLAVTGAYDYTVRVWDLADGRLSGKPLTGHTGVVGAVACTTIDGRPVAVTGASDLTVRIWDLTTGQQYGEPLTGYRRELRAIACTTVDGHPVAVTGSGDGEVRIWDLTTGRLHCEPRTDHSQWVHTIACTTVDGHPVAVTGGGDGTVRVLDVITGRPRGEPFAWRSSRMGGDFVSAIACTTLDDRPVAVSVAHRTVRLWDLKAHRPCGEFPVDTDHFLNSVACTTLDGRQVVVIAHSDRSISMWDVATGQPYAESLAGHTDQVFAVVCTMVGARPVVVSTSHDRTVRVWDLAARTRHGGANAGHDAAVAAVACASEGAQPVAISASPDRTLRVWDLNTGQSRGKLAVDDAGRVGAIACTTVGDRPVVVTGADDYVIGGTTGTVRVWDLTTRREWATLSGHDRTVSAVVCTTVNGRPIAVTAGLDNTMRVWDITSGRAIGKPVACHAGEVIDMACVTLNGRPAVVTISNNTFGSHTSATAGLAYHVVNGHCTLRTRYLNSRVLRSGALDRGTTLTETASMTTALATTIVNGHPVAVTGSENGAVQVWNLTTGRQEGDPLTGHTGRVFAVVCTTIAGSPVAVTGSNDRTVQVWNLVHMRRTHVIPFPAEVYTLAATADGLVVVGAGHDVSAIELHLDE